MTATNHLQLARTRGVCPGGPWSLVCVLYGPREGEGAAARARTSCVRGRRVTDARSFDFRSYVTLAPPSQARRQVRFCKNPLPFKFSPPSPFIFMNLAPPPSPLAEISYNLPEIT